MRVIYSEQYNTACVVPEGAEAAEDIISFAEEQGAVYEDFDDDTVYVVQLRPEIGPELYTESAIRRSTPYIVK